MEFGVGPALHGLGDDLPPGAELGCADSGVLTTNVDAVDINETVDAEADVGVYGLYGEVRESGKLSIILALLGGTAGGVDSDLKRSGEV